MRSEGQRVDGLEEWREEGLERWKEDCGEDSVLRGLNELGGNYR